MARTLVLIASLAAASSCARQEGGGDPLRDVRVLDAGVVAAGAPRGEPAQMPGPAEARGALVYVEQGCVACHAPPGIARPAFAPDHAAAGFHGGERLREVIRHPEAFHPGTIMPAYDLAEGDERDLVAYLLSRKGGGPARAPAAAAGSCASCHAAAAPAEFEHGCAYIAARAEELSCARCHERVPGGDRCAFVEAHRALCTVCHEAGAGGER